MIELSVALAYLLIGLALFFSFWRWCAIEGDNAGNNIVSLMLLFLWPVTLSALAFGAFMTWLLDSGEKVMKK